MNLPLALRDFLCTFSFSLHLFPSIDNDNPLTAHTTLVPFTVSAKQFRVLALT